MNKNSELKSNMRKLEIENENLKKKIELLESNKIQPIENLKNGEQSKLPNYVEKTQETKFSENRLMPVGKAYSLLELEISRREFIVVITKINTIFGFIGNIFKYSLEMEHKNKIQRTFLYELIVQYNLINLPLDICVN